MNFKRLLYLPAAAVFNRLLSLLHNGDPYNFTREDIRWLQFSFSQFGEDFSLKAVIRELGLTRGFYVDAGAFHPQYFSNTLLLYRDGWRGVNIDVSPEKIALFNEHRPEDRNIQAWLSDREEEVQVVCSNTNLDRIVKAGDVLPESDRSKVRRDRTQTLTQVLEQHGIAPRPIDYLNIDCEGYDLAVLKGLDLSRYPVRMLTIEAWGEANEREIMAYAQAHGFEFSEKLKLTLFFVRK